MPLEPKAQLIDPQGPIDVTGVNATGVTTATGGFVGNIQGSATGLASTTLNITAGIITATRFIGDVTGTASSLAQGANITVGIMTATFVGDLLGNATGLTTTTSNLNLGIVTSTGFRGNFTGLSSGLSGTPNIQTGIVTATKFLGNSTGTVVDLADDTNINVGIITATKFEGNTTGSVTDLADDTNINVGIITASKFIGNANGSVTGLADDTNINVATFTGTQFIGNSPGTAADLKSGTNLTVGTFTGTKFIGNTPGSATKMADDVNVAASTFTGTKFVGNTPGTVSDIADDTNLNMGTLTGTKFEGNTTGSVSAISDDTNLNLGTLTASQFIGNTPGNAAGISAGKNLNAGAVVATTFFGSGAAITGAGVTGFISQNVTAADGTTTINLNDGNVIYLTHSNNTTIAFSNVPTATRVVISRTITDNTITWPSDIIWSGGSAPTLIGASDIYEGAAQVFNLNTTDGGTTWYGWEIVNNSTKKSFKLFTWGHGYNGQNAQNNRTNYSSPTQVPGTNWHVLADSGTSVAYVGAAVKSDGTLWIWGNPSEGGDFLGLLGQSNAIPGLYAMSSPIQIPGTTWSDVQKGSKAFYATKTDNTLWVWGYNDRAALGQNNKTNYSSPIQIPGTWGLGESKVTGGSECAGAIRADGTMWTWGLNNEGQLGLNNKTQYSSPKQIPGTTWNTISVNGSKQFLATKTDGTLWAWGTNSSGELGQNDRTDRSSPIQIPGTTWSSCSGGQSVLATKTDNTLWAWGYNTDYGLLGQNEGGSGSTRYSSPTQIPGTNWKQGARAYFTTETSAGAVKTDGTLWTWGHNGSGQLGHNNRTNYSSPVQIPGTKWVSAASSYNTGSNYATQEV